MNALDLLFILHDFKLNLLFLILSELLFDQSLLFLFLLIILNTLLVGKLLLGKGLFKLLNSRILHSVSHLIVQDHISDDTPFEDNGMIGKLLV